MCHFEYATYTIPDVLNLIFDLNDTRFHFPDHLRRLLRRCVFVLNFCLIENDKIPPNLNARAGMEEEEHRRPTLYCRRMFILGKFISCNGISMAKKCVCIGDDEHVYDRFMAGMLINLCPKTDKSIVAYLKE